MVIVSLVLVIVVVIVIVVSVVSGYSTLKIRNVAHIIMCAIGAYYRYVYREAHILNESADVTYHGTLHKLCVLIKLCVPAECVITGIGQQDPKIYGIK